MLHVERHASCKVIRLCHKNVINCIMAVGQIKRMISLTYADPFLVHALVPILINPLYTSVQFSGQKLNSCNHECPLQWTQNGAR